eukprot:CAMPEP_0169298516 /NCGR_PEP_ID=MMETSP1016-20121227/66523_1 /TAXON_ID=342587 /ORGANISM="Karlodinium micrum, Strain CCMP2283" /LENGTH=61 /DNA_ID=CAMNT_0009390595 /DNA_START=65 /DNA_END=250 /DNA_ORIENTATION=-
MTGCNRYTYKLLEPAIPTTSETLSGSAKLMTSMQITPMASMMSDDAILPTPSDHEPFWNIP